MYIHTDSSCITVDRLQKGHARPVRAKRRPAPRLSWPLRGRVSSVETQVKISKNGGIFTRCQPEIPSGYVKIAIENCHL